MSWIATGVSVAGSLIGGMGGSKSGERAAKDANFTSNLMMTEAQRNAQSASRPFVESGTQANRLLSQYLGTDTSGFGPAPTREQAAAQVAKKHYEKYGSNYDRNSSQGWIEQQTDKVYRNMLKEYETGLAKWKAENPDQMGDGRLLKEFTNEDFVKDPGYNFRRDEGNQAIDRNFAARGGSDSGAALKAIARFNQDYASNEFGNAYARDLTNKNSIYNMLSGQSAQGLGAAQNNSQLAFNAASQAGANNQNLANNVWNAQLQRNENQANALQSGIGNLLYGIRKGNQSVTGRLPDGGYGGWSPATQPKYVA